MKQFRILIIDSESSERSSFEEVFLLNGYDVKTVSNGSEGLSILSSDSFDLILIDFDLPLKDGLQTCLAIKEDVILKRTPVIFIIGLESLVLLNEIYQSGGDDFITKPLLWSELLSKARIHLELKYSREMSRNLNQMLETKVARRTIELEDSLKNLAKANKELESLSLAKTEFLNMISHEIRTPLNGIMGSMALIGSVQLSDEVERYFRLLDTSVKRLEKFSNVILDASTLRLKGEKALLFEMIDIESVINNSIAFCKLVYPEKGLMTEFANSLPGIKIRADQKYLLKSLNAVLGNAFKFSHKNDKIQICVGKSSNNFVIISITDHGQGFSDTSISNIFQPLSNLEGHFDQNTGMGLHLAKSIVEAHSGIIKVRNNVPNGATVEIMLPIEF